MGSTIRSSNPPIQLQTNESVQWRSWPLVDRPALSWLVPASILLLGGIVFQLGGGWSLTLMAIAAVAVAMWQFLMPVKFEVTTLGLRRYAFGRVRLVPWQAIRAYQLRPTGVVFFQRPNPSKIDLLNSLFVPYPPDADEMLVAVRQYLSHAEVLSL
jgi:hypothetical protein